MQYASSNVGPLCGRLLTMGLVRSINPSNERP
jgi:hypothetical protein